MGYMLFTHNVQGVSGVNFSTMDHLAKWRLLLSLNGLQNVVWFVAHDENII